LAINARDAMPEGGLLTLSAENASSEALPDGARGGLPPGDYVALSVSDTGTGMTEEVLARAFEPFFTTKAVGRGSGLGLSQVYGFARQSGGMVAVVSRPGEGTQVTVWLPRASGNGQERLPPSTPEGRVA
ncbi:ATP-binding protein, partial [Paracraurococcus lichenis]